MADAGTTGARVMNVALENQIGRAWETECVPYTREEMALQAQEDEILRPGYDAAI